MGQKPDTSPSERFIRVLRDGLNHLYDPSFLRHSPLADLFGVGERFDTPSALQTILTRAIESLRPTSNTPNKPHAQATYDILLYRYVQQINQEEIANQMGISVRQLRRQQNVAVLELACRLWNQHGLDSQPDYAAHHDAVPAAFPDSRPEKGGSSQIAEELGWLKNSSLQGVTDLAITFPEVLNLIRPLAEQRHTQIICQSGPEGLVSVHPVAFQEIVLNLLSLAIHCASGSDVKLEIVPSGRDVVIQLSGGAAMRSQQQSSELESRMKVVSQLVQLSHGQVEFVASNQQFRSRVTFRATPPLNVLVIDDNPEIVTVMQRFAAETRYRVMGIHDPKSVIEQAAKLAPDIIVLDIMMPQIDGLQVLSRLKHHPELGKIPVIVCSVLPHMDLAASLGASGFIQKPFQRDTFIATLSQHSPEME